MDLLMDPCKFTPFGVAVKAKLLKRGRGQKWLAQEVSNCIGIYVDSGYLYKILTGQRKDPRVVQVIREVLNISEEQEQRAGAIQKTFEKYRDDPACRGQV